jgi:hypothetical protein
MPSVFLFQKYLINNWYSIFMNKGC